MEAIRDFAGSIRSRLVPAATAAFAIAVGVVLFTAGPSESAPGALTHKGCIDDDDNGTDPGQGPDTCGDSTDGLSAARTVVVSRDGRSVYASSEGDNAIVRFKRNRDTGALTPKGCIDDNDAEGVDDCAQSADGLNRPASLVLSRDGKWLHAASELDDAIARFKRNQDTGALAPRGCYDDNDPPGGPEDCIDDTNGLSGVTSIALSPDGKSLYAASETDDAIVRFKRDPDNGKLTPRGCIDDTDTGLGQGPDNCADSTIGLGRASHVAVSADGKWVYATSEDDNAIVRFRRNRRGALTPRGCLDDNPDGADNCARDTGGLNSLEMIVLSRDGKSAYAVGEGDNAIVRFKRDPDNGKLTPRGCIEDDDVAPNVCAEHTQGLNEPAWIAISRDGKSLYATGGDDAIVRFKRNRDTGALTPKGCIDDNDPGSGLDNCAQSKNGLDDPEAIAFSRDDGWLYVASEGDDAIVRFKRATG
jgi:6-phosphogluconolactonase (cycloisomerase 2 family)